MVHLSEHHVQPGDIFRSEPKRELALAPLSRGPLLPRCVVCMSHSSRSLRSRKAQQTAAHETLLQAFDSIVAVVQLLTCVQLSATPWTAAHQASLSFIISQSLLKLMSIELVMPSNHLILFRPLVLLPSIFPSIRVFSNDLALHIRWPEY